MKIIIKQQKSELFIYSALWLIVFLAPVVDGYLKAGSNDFFTFRWSNIKDIGCGILPFFLLFLVHNFLLAPRLLLMRKTLLYIVSIVGTLLIFQLFLWHDSPIGPDRIPQEMKRHNPFRQDNFNNPNNPNAPNIQDNHDENDQTAGFRLPIKDNAREERMEPHPRPLFFPQPTVIKILIAVLMIGFNIAVKLFFKSQRDEEVLKELERHNLQQELEYLKYQINPHFFMNTLNNIHALVDIDAEKAKTTILDLSKLMRYVLYEGSNRTILLSREVEFLNNYIALMRLRYTDKVKIETELPAEIPEVLIPPLLFISFVENAFKHGVSYRMVSFIRLSIKMEDGELSFRCANSNCGKSNDPYSGIGLDNVRKRLNLLYGDAYRLQLEEKPELFNVLLVIPVTT